MVALQRPVRVPAASAAVTAMIDLHKTHAPFNEPPSRQAEHTAADCSDRATAERRRAAGRDSSPDALPCRRNNRPAAFPVRQTEASYRSATQGRSGPTTQSSESNHRHDAARYETEV